MHLLIGFISLFTLFLLFLFIWIFMKTRNQGKRFMSRISNLSNFKMDQFIMGLQNDFLIAVDEGREMYAYIDTKEEFVFSFDSVIGVMLLQDYKIVSEQVSSRIQVDHQLAEIYNQNKANLFLKRKEGDADRKKSTLRIYISLADASSPLLEIYCFNSKTQLFGGSRTLDVTNQESQLYRRGLQIGHHIFTLLTKGIDRMDRSYEDQKSKGEVKVLIPNLVANELEKLAELRDKGVISEGEYNIQKERLLSF